MRDKTHQIPLTDPASRRLIQTILQPIHAGRVWKKRTAAAGEQAFLSGLRLEGAFPGENGLLDTARADFEEFFQSFQSGDQSRIPCRLVQELKLEPEEHGIRVNREGVEIRSADIEGVRRALVWIEDEMLKRGGPFLPAGLHRRKAVIKTRISRCFFGPINRPPGNRDELADDVNYYPDAYLNRLAHDGVNVLWLTIKFRNTVPSKIFPEFAPDAARRLAKLRDTVQRCARFGIRVFVFCIEPDSLPLDSPVFARHPELKGHVIDFRAAFCTSTKAGKAYLVEAAKTLFSHVPGLGGMIVIPVGERFSQCSSIALPESGTTEEPCNCPRCARRSLHDVLHDTLAALRRGMVAANPTAELISWPYGQLIMWGEKMTVESARHLPKGVVLQHNFETGGTNRQLGKERPLCDYWLSVVGPSPVFRKASRAARAEGNRVSAKLQVGCSHEDATVPFVPVPGLLYSKYHILHDLGVSAVMQSWYFGNYPSLMTRAAGCLSFSPLPKNEAAFLADLAARDWQDQAPHVVKAWFLFRQSYENYPSTHLFGYYGPVQDGLVWPVHLIPRNRPLAPTWKLGYPPSGDYLADCLSSEFTLSEVVTLCGRMARLWGKGLRHLEKAWTASNQTVTQRQEWNVAQAIGLQFETAAGILRFYQLREILTETTGKKALLTLRAMEEIIRREVERRKKMLDLCEQEPTLGFHPEAEGFKVTPAMLRRGLRSLQRLVKKEFPAVRRIASRNEELFPKYTGRSARRRLVFGSAAPPRNALNFFLTQNSAIPGVPLPGSEWHRSSRENSPIRSDFQTGVSAEGIQLAVFVRPGKGFPEMPHLPPWIATVIVDVEPRRLHPRIQFSADTRGFKTSLMDDGYLMKELLPFEARWEIKPGEWMATLVLPLTSLRMKRASSIFRFNLRVAAFNKKTDERYELSWSARRPLQPRQAWDDANPARDYGWAELSMR